MTSLNYTPLSFAQALLTRLAKPVTRDNLKAIVGWEKAEGGNWNNNARFNPLNTTENMPGSGDVGTQGNISSYQNWQQGLDATVKTLTNGLYSGILGALGQKYNPTAVGRAIENSPWGTGGLAAKVIASTPLPGTGATQTSMPTDTTPAPTSSVTAGTGAKAAVPQQSQVIPKLLTIFGAMNQANSNQPWLGSPALAPKAQQTQAQTDPYSAIIAAGQPDPAASATGVGTPPGSVTTSTTRPTTQSHLTTPPADTGSVNVPGTHVFHTTYAGVTETLHASTKIPNVNPTQALKLKGLISFNGVPVAAWIAPALAYAQAHGWKGTVSEGYRTDRQQKAIYDSGVRPAAVPRAEGGGGSNHEVDAFPGGAVDVTDPQGLSNILLDSPWAHFLVYAGAKDPVHFSHPHNGHY